MVINNSLYPSSQLSLLISQEICQVRNFLQIKTSELANQKAKIIQSYKTRLLPSPNILNTMGNLSSKTEAKESLGIDRGTISTLSAYLYSRAGAIVEYRYRTNKDSNGGTLNSQYQLEDLVRKLGGEKVQEFKYKFMVVDPEWLWPFPANVKGSGDFKSAF